MRVVEGRGGYSTSSLVRFNHISSLTALAVVTSSRHKNCRDFLRDARFALSKSTLSYLDPWKAFWLHYTARDRVMHDDVTGAFVEPTGACFLATTVILDCDTAKHSLGL